MNAISASYDAEVYAGVYLEGATNSKEVQHIQLGTAENEVQTIQTNATSGQFKLTYNGQTTSALAYNVSAADLQTALCSLSGIGAAGVAVTGDYLNGWTVTFSTAGDKNSITASIVAGSTLTTSSTDGSSTAREIQEIVNSGHDDLTFSFNGSAASKALLYGFSASDLQTLLNSFSAIASLGGVTVSTPSTDTWRITFNNNGNMPVITATTVAFKGVKDATSTDGTGSTPDSTDTE